jgi:hypothetical protein
MVSLLLDLHSMISCHCLPCNCFSAVLEVSDRAPFVLRPGINFSVNSQGVACTEVALAAVPKRESEMVSTRCIP